VRQIYAEEVTKHVRLTILRVLVDSHDWRANESILATMVDEMGISVDRPKVVEEIRWLETAGLVEVTDISGFLIAQCTEEGMQVARGRKTYEGVRRPHKKS
jgi:Fe2+ or Zn2+ uptake regulation protein